MKVVLSLLLLIVLVHGATDIPEFIHRSYFPGRSGSISVGSTVLDHGSSVCLIRTPLDLKYQKDTIKDVNVASLIAHMLGVVSPASSLNPDRTGFPKVGLFDQPTASLIFVIDDFKKENFEDVSDMRFFKNSQAIQVEESARHLDTLSLLNTIVTGTTPSEHGITGSSWVAPTAEIITAYSSVFSDRRAHSLADRFRGTYDDSSFVFSASADRQMTASLASNVNNRPVSPNSYGFSFNQDSRGFENIYDRYFDGMLFGETALIDKLRDKASIFEILPGFEVEYSEKVNTLRVKVVEKNLEATFDLRHYNDIVLLLEIHFAQLLTQKMNSLFCNVVVDDSPDLISFGFTGLKNLEGNKLIVATFVLDATLEMLIQRFEQLYSNRFVAQYLLLSKTSLPQAMRSNQVQEEIIKISEPAAIENMQYINNMARYLPELFIDTHLDYTIVINRLEAYLATIGLNVFPFTSQSSEEHSNYIFLRDSQLSNITNTTSNNTDTTYYSQDEVLYFQTMIWVSILLIIAVLAAALSLCCFDPSKGSPLYLTSTTVK